MEPEYSEVVIKWIRETPEKFTSDELFQDFIRGARVVFAYWPSTDSPAQRRAHQDRAKAEFSLALATYATAAIPPMKERRFENLFFQMSFQDATKMSHVLMSRGAEVTHKEDQSIYRLKVDTEKCPQTTSDLKETANMEKGSVTSQIKESALENMKVGAELAAAEASVKVFANALVLALAKSGLDNNTMRHLRKFLVTPLGLAALALLASTAILMLPVTRDKETAARVSDRLSQVAFMRGFQDLLALIAEPLTVMLRAMGEPVHEQIAVQALGGGASTATPTETEPEPARNDRKAREEVVP